MNVYLSGSITPNPEHNQWRGIFHEQLGMVNGFSVFDPMRGKDVRDLDAKGYTSKIPASLFTERDRGDISRADVMVVVFRKGLPRQSIGTWWECGWANALEIPIILLTDDRDVFNHPFMQKWTAERIWMGDTATEVIAAYQKVIESVRFLDRPRW